MTAAINRTRPPASTNGHASTPPPKLKTTRINRARAGLGVLVTALSVIAVLTIYARADDRAEVLALANRVPAGQAIKASDLTTVEVPADSALVTVSADRAGAIVGQVALSALEPGTLLSPKLVALQPLIPVGSGVVGSLLKPGQYPVDLRVGDTVRIIETPAGSSEEAVPPIDRGAARVVDLADPPAGSAGITVSLLVADDDLVPLSSSGAAGRLSLAVVGS